ncbi:hypothetical protein FRC09_013943 [Ceratobasidium sp. 395]|nr:hypothetical protein FRC09_013943 [Ceratobasidium sp. 395]
MFSECPRMFLTPNLRELTMLERMEEYEDDIRDQTRQLRTTLPTKIELCSDLINLIHWTSHHCPRLEKLRLLPPNPTNATNKLAHSAYDKHVLLTNLRSFTLAISGAGAYGSVLQALGQIPYLEELILIGHGCWSSDKDPITLADGLFPCLQHLGLYGLCRSCTARICKASPFFRRLVKATIIYSETYPDGFEDYYRTIEALVSMGHNSPHLKDITVHPRGNDGLFVAALPVVGLLKQMSLTRLDLGYIVFDPQSAGYDEDDWDYEGDEITRNSSLEAQWTAFLSAVPRLEELRLEQQDFQQVQLELIASLLPGLRVFVAGIFWFYEPSMEVNASQSIMIRNKPRLGSCQNILELATFVTFLARLVCD